MRKFVLLSTQRSGSTWVIDMLNSHPQIKAYEELFLGVWKEKPTWAGAQDVLTWNAFWQCAKERGMAFKPVTYFRYLDGIFTPGERVSAIGFKLMYNQLRHNLPILAYLLVKKVRVVHLIRSNFLNVILSEEAGPIRGIPHTYGQAKKVTVFLDETHLVQRLRWKEAKVRYAKRIFSHLGVPYLEIVYEDLVADQDKFGEVLSFLAVPPAPQDLSSALKRLNKSTHQELIGNYESVKNTLDVTRYRELLD